MDHSAHSAGLFSKHAEAYRDKYMDLTLYHDSYRGFCGWLTPGRARVLDAACGPGNVSRYLLAQRPDLDLLGIDLAPRMVELARDAVPAARFVVHDCRKLADLNRRFDGILCAFGLPYLSWEEGVGFLRAAAQALGPGGVLYLSTMLGEEGESGLQRTSTGDQIYITYHSEGPIIATLQDAGFSILQQQRLPSPSNASKATTDLVVIAKK